MNSKISFAYLKDTTGLLNGSKPRHNNHAGLDNEIGTTNESAKSFSETIVYSNYFDGYNITTNPDPKRDEGLPHSVSDLTINMITKKIKKDVFPEKVEYYILDLRYKIFLGSVLEGGFNADNYNSIRGQIRNNNLNFGTKIESASYGLKGSIIGNLAKNISNTKIDIVNNKLYFNINTGKKKENEEYKFSDNTTSRSYLSGSLTAAALYNTLGNIKDNILEIDSLRILGKLNAAFALNSTDEAGKRGFFGAYYYFDNTENLNFANITQYMQNNKVIFNDIGKENFVEDLDNGENIFYEIYGAIATQPATKITDDTFKINISGNGVELKASSKENALTKYKNIIGAYSEFNGDLENNYVILDNVYLNEDKNYTTPSSIIGAKTVGDGDLIKNHVNIINGTNMSDENIYFDKNFTEIIGAYAENTTTVGNLSGGGNYVLIDNKTGHLYNTTYGAKTKNVTNIYGNYINILSGNIYNSLFGVSVENENKANVNIEGNYILIGKDNSLKDNVVINLNKISNSAGRDNGLVLSNVQYIDKSINETVVNINNNKFYIEDNSNSVKITNDLYNLTTLANITTVSNNTMNINLKNTNSKIDGDIYNIFLGSNNKTTATNINNNSLYFNGQIGGADINNIYNIYNSNTSGAENNKLTIGGGDISANLYNILLNNTNSNLTDLKIQNNSFVIDLENNLEIKSGNIYNIYNNNLLSDIEKNNLFIDDKDNKLILKNFAYNVYVNSIGLENKNLVDNKTTINLSNNTSELESGIFNIKIETANSNDIVNLTQNSLNIYAIENTANLNITNVDTNSSIGTFLKNEINISSLKKNINIKNSNFYNLNIKNSNIKTFSNNNINISDSNFFSTIISNSTINNFYLDLSNNTIDLSNLFEGENCINIKLTNKSSKITNTDIINYFSKPDNNETKIAKNSKININGAYMESTSGNNKIYSAEGFSKATNNSIELQNSFIKGYKINILSNEKIDEISNNTITINNSELINSEIIISNKSKKAENNVLNINGNSIINADGEQNLKINGGTIVNKNNIYEQIFKGITIENINNKLNSLVYNSIVENNIYIGLVTGSDPDENYTSNNNKLNFAGTSTNYANMALINYNIYLSKALNSKSYSNKFSIEYANLYAKNNAIIVSNTDNDSYQNTFSILNSWFIGDNNDITISKSEKSASHDNKFSILNSNIYMKNGDPNSKIMISSSNTDSYNNNSEIINSSINNINDFTISKSVNGNSYNNTAIITSSTINNIFNLIVSNSLNGNSFNNTVNVINSNLENINDLIISNSTNSDSYNNTVDIVSSNLKNIKFLTISISIIGDSYNNTVNIIDSNLENIEDFTISSSELESKKNTLNISSSSITNSNINFIKAEIDNPGQIVEENKINIADSIITNSTITINSKNGTIDLNSDALADKSNLLTFSGNNKILGKTTITTGTGNYNVMVLNNIGEIKGTNNATESVEFKNESSNNGLLIINQNLVNKNKYDNFKISSTGNDIIFAGNDIGILSSDILSSTGKIKFLNSYNSAIKDYVEDTGDSNFIIYENSNYNNANLEFEKGIKLEINLDNLDNTKSIIKSDGNINILDNSESAENDKIILNVNRIGDQTEYILFDSNGKNYLETDFALGNNIKNIKIEGDKLTLNTMRNFDSIFEKSSYKYTDSTSGNEVIEKVYLDLIDDYKDFTKIMGDSYNNMYDVSNRNKYNGNAQLNALSRFLDVFNYYDSGNNGENYDESIWNSEKANNIVETILKTWLPSASNAIYKAYENNFNVLNTEINNRLESLIGYDKGYLIDGRDSSYNYLLAKTADENNNIFDYDYSIDKSKRTVVKNWFKVVQSNSKQSKMQFDEENYKIKSSSLIFGKETFYGEKYLFGGLASINKNSIDIKYRDIDIMSYNLTLYGRYNLNSYFFVNAVLAGYFNKNKEISKDFNINYESKGEEKNLSDIKIKSSYDSFQLSSSISFGIDTRFVLAQGFANINAINVEKFSDSLEMDVSSRKMNTLRLGGRSVIRNILNIGNDIFKIKPEFYAEISTLIYEKIDNISIGLNENSSRFHLPSLNLTSTEIKIGGNLNLLFKSKINLQLSFSMSKDKNNYTNSSIGIGGFYKF